MGLFYVQIIRTSIPLMIIFTCTSDGIFSDSTTMLYVFFLFLLMVDRVIQDIGCTNRRSFAANAVIWICLFIIILALIKVLQENSNVNNMTVSVAFYLMIYCNVYLCKGGIKCLCDNTSFTAIETDSLIFIFSLRQYFVVYILYLVALTALAGWKTYTVIYYDEFDNHLIIFIILSSLLYIVYALLIQILAEVKVVRERRGTGISNDFENECLRDAKFIHQIHHWIFGRFLSKCSMLYIFSLFMEKLPHWDKEYHDTFPDDIKSEHMLYGCKRVVNSLIRTIIISNIPYNALLEITVDEVSVLISLCCLYFSHINIYNRFYNLTKFIKYLIVVTISALVIIYAIVSAGEHKLQNITENQLSIYSHLSANGYDKIAVRDNLGSLLYERYEGEDVSFECRTNQNHYVTLKWYRNNTLIRKVDDRITVVSSNAKFHKQGLESLLQIKMLKDEDFTTYMCVAEEVLLAGSDQFLLKEVIQNYTIVSKSSQPDVYHVPLGSLLSYRTVVYATSAGEDELSFKYTVNGIDFNDICVEEITSCDTPAFLFMKVLSRDLSVEFLKSLYFMKVISVDIRSCMCSAMYGIHEITIYRNYFNKTSNKSEIHEIAFPKKFYFFPTVNFTILEEYMFTNNLQKNYIARILNESDVLSFSTLFGHIRINSFNLVNHISLGLFVVVIFGFLKLIKYMTFIYCKCTIFPFRNKILFGVWRALIPSINASTFAGIAVGVDQCYDVYISYSDNDYERANVVLSFVEKNCKLKACFPDRDLSHQGGVSKLHLYTKATQQSNKIIVLLSKSYVEESDCNDLQLVRCILPLLLENLRPKKNLIIIKLDECVDLPVQIKWDPCVNVVKWLSANDEINAKLALKKYLYQ